MEFLSNLTFHQTLIIAIGVFLTDFISGLTASIRSGRHIKSSIMQQGLSQKAVNYFNYLVIGLAFYMASTIGEDDSAYLHNFASLIVLVPTVPELLSVFENVKTIVTKISKKESDSNE